MNTPALYAVDPGTRLSALVVLDGDTVRHAVLLANDELRDVLALDGHPGTVLLLEQIESQGMAVGRETFETVHWCGRFHEAWAADGGTVVRLTRRTVKLAVCGTTRANDGTIRRELLDRWGGDRAIGTKKHQGPLYTVKSHCWSALALAVTYRLAQAPADAPPPE